MPDQPGVPRAAGRVDRPPPHPSRQEASVSEDPEDVREHEREAQERDPDERPPEERRGEAGDMADEGLREGVPGSAANRPSG
jgi:hypothetical protein